MIHTRYDTGAGGDCQQCYSKRLYHQICPFEDLITVIVIVALSESHCIRANLSVILPRSAAHGAAEVAAAAAAAHGPAGHAAAGAVVEEQPVPLVGGEPEGQRPRLPHLPRRQHLNWEEL